MPVPRQPQATPNSISEITRRDIFDYIDAEVVWNGRLDEPGFLERIWDLADIRSTDGRFKDAAGDIWQHRINNPEDWPENWVFHDDRFDLMHGPDEIVLRFLCEMVHPAVRPDRDEAEQIVRGLNAILAGDWWELVSTRSISGRPIYEAHRMGAVRHPSTALRLEDYERLADPGVFRAHLRRIENALPDDPAGVIGSSKELVESVCKVVLDDYGVDYSNKDDALALYKKVAIVLKLNAESVPESARGSEAAQGALRAMTTTVQRLAELRNALGTGHGRSQRSVALARHARLAFATAAALCEFLLDTWHERRDGGH